MNTSVKALGTGVRASRNRLRDHQEKFENLPNGTKVNQTCEIAGLMRKVSHASEQFMMLIMDLEGKLEHAESTHNLVTVRVLSPLDTRRSSRGAKHGKYQERYDHF